MKLNHRFHRWLHLKEAKQSESKHQRLIQNFISQTVLLTEHKDSTIANYCQLSFLSNAMNPIQAKSKILNKNSS